MGQLRRGPAAGHHQRKAFCHGGLPHARLADQDGVVLRPAREDLHRAADLSVPADHRVDPARESQRRQVAAVLIQRPCLRAPQRGGADGSALRTGTFFLARAEKGEQLRAEDIGIQPCAQQQLFRAAVLAAQDGQEQMLGADKAVAQKLCLAPGGLDHPARVLVQPLGRRAGNARAESFTHGKAKLALSRAAAQQKARRGCIPFGENAEEQMLAAYKAVAEGGCLGQGAFNGAFGALGEFLVASHGFFSFSARGTGSRTVSYPIISPQAATKRAKSGGVKKLSPVFFNVIILFKNNN